MAIVEVQCNESVRTYELGTQILASKHALDLELHSLALSQRDRVLLYEAWQREWSASLLTWGELRQGRDVLGEIAQR